MDTTVVMTDNTSDTMNQPESIKKTGLGARLKTAREAMQLTEKEAAARLRLKVEIISLMEAENFAVGPPATFIRGYLRSYTRLLNFPEPEIELILKKVENSLPTGSSNPIVSLSTSATRYQERYLRWFTYLIVLGLATLVSLWWNGHSRYAAIDTSPKTTVVTTTSPAAKQPQILYSIHPAIVSTKPSASAQPLKETSTPILAAKPVTKKPKSSNISQIELALPEPGGES